MLNNQVAKVFIDSPFCIQSLLRSTMAVAFSRPIFYASLAEEVIYNILVHFTKDPIAANRTALLTCLQVSQQFHRITIPLLYRETTCMQRPSGCQAYEAQLFEFHQCFFEANPGAAMSVQYLTLHGGMFAVVLLATFKLI